MERKDRTSSMLMLLYSLLICALLVLVVAGARLYGSTVDNKLLHSTRRSALSYIQSQAAASEGSAVALESGPEGTMLCLYEADGDYVTRIYLAEGYLRTELSPLSVPAAPERSERICALEEFALSREPGGLLKIQADGLVGWVYCGGEPDEK